MASCILVEIQCVSGERYCLRECDVAFQKTVFFVTMVVRALSFTETVLHNVCLSCVAVGGRRISKTVMNFFEMNVVTVH
jgi:hypothetical protein